MTDYQNTLDGTRTVSGIGLHTGEQVKMTFSPAPPDSGIQFVIKGSSLSSKPIKAYYKNVSGTNRGTTLTENSSSVHTVEHVLAALYANNIDNALVTLSASEPPICDGSAIEFVSMIASAGIKKQEVKAKVLTLDKPFIFEEKGKSLKYFPSDKFEVVFSLAYDDKILPDQTFSAIITPQKFNSLISRARTFGFEHEFDMLKQHNLALGGSLENAVIINRDGTVRNPEGLRFPEELVVHKVLDLIGDFSLLGMRILGKIEAFKSGHAFNQAFVKQLFEEFANTNENKGVFL